VDGLDQSGSEQGQILGSCEHGNGPSISINFGEFLDQSSNCQLLMKDPSSWS